MSTALPPPLLSTPSMANRWAEASLAQPLDQRSRALRRLVIRALDGGERGHIGPSMSLIEIMRSLYDHVARHDPKKPDWPERDRIILSKGHGCLALYALLADHGYFPDAEIETFCRRDSRLGGHPERGKLPGVEASTGALGHGLSIGLGMALAARLRGQSHSVFVVMGDGEINEGSVWEAAMAIGKHRLERLVAVVDYNKLQSYGLTDDVQPLEPLADKWQAFGFETVQINGHDVEAMTTALTAPRNGKPLALICHTVKGKGIPWAEFSPEWHHKSRLNPDEIQALYAALEAE